MLQYSNAYIDEEDIEAVKEVLRTGYDASLPKVREFEAAVARYVGTKFAVGLNSGTSALHASMFAVGMGDGDEAITSPITFAATSNAVLYMRGKPVFSDIDPRTYNLDADLVEKEINQKTKAIVPVHYTGQPCEMNKFVKLAKENDLKLVEDAAHALGAKYGDRMAGTFGDAAVLSFHSVKHITTYEGGMVLTDNEEIYEKIKLFRSHGITRERRIMGVVPEEGEDWVSDQVHLGYNYRLSDVQAALGLSQLKKLGKFVDIRRKYAKMYTDAFEKLEFVEPPYQLARTDSSWHLYVLRFDTKKLGMSRVEIFHKLRRMGIGVWVHYPPVYYMSYYQKLGYKKGLCKNAEKLYAEILTLPLYPKMNENEVQMVIDTIKKVVK